MSGALQRRRHGDLRGGPREEQRVHDAHPPLGVQPEGQPPVRAAQRRRVGVGRQAENSVGIVPGVVGRVHCTLTRRSAA